MSRWHEVLRLSEQRSVVAGGPQQLCAAIDAGADLRIATEFRHNEHIDPGSTSAQLIREVAELRVTYLIEECWPAGEPAGRLWPPIRPVAVPVQPGRQPRVGPHLSGRIGPRAY